MTAPELRVTDLCFVCGGNVMDGDEPGHTQMDNGVWVPNCSEACAEKFYGE